MIILIYKWLGRKPEPRIFRSFTKINILIGCNLFQLYVYELFWVWDNHWHCSGKRNFHPRRLGATTFSRMAHYRMTVNIRKFNLKTFKIRTYKIRKFNKRTFNIRNSTLGHSTLGHLTSGHWTLRHLTLGYLTLGCLTLGH